MNENGGRGGGGVKMFARKGGVGQIGGEGRVCLEMGDCHFILTFF